ncbi:hypothetical protein BVC80_8301g3 [Macleaya cordata]|uniref:Zinc finger protein n=1 Tax=Macleaya cordata TaxID=56857 RepID=A0A200QRQ3_MACCD|nr:hypothetical protein BVC80_8301g3 [Macleaya cordata]
MGGGEGSSSHSQDSCQMCEQKGHTGIECSWAYSRCKLTPCNGVRKIVIAKTEANYGRRFLRCQQPDCSGFQCLDDALGSVGSQSTQLSRHGGCFGCGEANH